MKEFIDELFEKFSKIGKNEEGHGYTRLGYGEIEDKMHEALIEVSKAEGFKHEIDEVGNLYIFDKEYPEYILMGSHLDSVTEGGNYDGILGVTVAMSILKEIKDKNLNIPFKVVAFRCEESSNFMYAMVGSKLIANEFPEEKKAVLKNREGKLLKDIFSERGYSINPNRISNVKMFLETHIEQGRVLESENLKIGLVNTIAGSKRMIFKIKGMAEHSGATPMNIRNDSLVAAAEIISEVEKIGRETTETSVATVGFIKNTPNSMNVVPGYTEISIDLRDITDDGMKEMAKKVLNFVEELKKRREVAIEIEDFPLSSAVKLSDEIVRDFSKVLDERKVPYKIMPSGAGHDCMVMAKLFPSALVFIPCKGGISHNPKEDIDFEDAYLDEEVILEFLKEI